MQRTPPDGTMTTVAGNGTPGDGGCGGLASRAQLSWPRAMAMGVDGSLYIADTGNHRIQKVTSDGVISTVAGSGAPGYSGDGAWAACAQLNGPRDVEVGADGNLYIADTENHCVRMVTADGVISTLAGTGTHGFGGDGGSGTHAQLAYPQDIALRPDGSLYIAVPRSHCIRKVWGVAGTAQGDPTRL